jgi:hypothetical protein
LFVFLLLLLLLLLTGLFIKIRIVKGRGSPF